MLERIPEPELMLESEQAKAYSEADFAESHDAFVSRLREALPTLPPVADVLDLGCGPADVTARLAHAFPGWHFDGVDASPAMLSLGRERLERLGLAQRVTLHELHLPTSKLPKTTYDVVVSNSLLHHLHEADTLWSAVRRHTRPGGHAFVMDLLRPRDETELQALLTQAASEPEVLQQDFHNSLRAAYTTEEVRTQLLRHRLDHFVVRRAGDRHWIAWGQP